MRRLTKGLRNHLTQRHLKLKIVLFNFRQWLCNSLRPGTVTRIGDTGVADPSSSEPRLTIGVGRSCFSCWFDSGVRWTWLLLIVLVGVSTSIVRPRCWCCFDDFFWPLKVCDENFSIWRQGLGLVPGVEHCLLPRAHALSYMHTHCRLSQTAYSLTRDVYCRKWMVLPHAALLA